MFRWIAENWTTILISLLLLALVVWIVVSLLKNRKKGKSSCGCNCAHCAMAGSCHNHQK